MVRPLMSITLLVLAPIFGPIQARADTVIPQQQSTASAAPDDLQRQYNAGDNAYQKQDYATALTLWDAGLAQAKAQSARTYIPQFLTSIGNVDLKLGRYADALSLYQQGLAIDREIYNRLGAANALGNIGVVDDYLGRYDEALSSHQQALVIYREIRNRRGEADTLGNLGNVDAHLGRYADALSLYQQGLAIDREIYNRLGEANALGNIGVVEEDLGRYDEALSSHQQALAIKREIHDRLSEADTLGNIGVVYDDLGRYAEALSSHREALAIHREIHSRGGEASDLGNLGVVDENLGRYVEALVSHQQALAIDREIHDRLGEANALGNIGVVDEDLGRYADALSSHQQALAIDREIHNRRGEASNLGNIGNVDMLLGRYADALSSHQHALAIDREIHNRLGEANDLENIGNVAGYLGHYAEALTAYAQSLAIDREIRNGHGEASNFNNIGAVDEDLGRFADALSSQQQALAIDREIRNRHGEANVLGNVGNVDVKLGRYAEALSSHEQSLAIDREIHNRLGEADTLGNIGIVDAHIGRYSDALAAYQQALAAHREIHDPLGEARDLTNVGVLDNRLGRYSDARQNATDSVKLLSGLKAANLWISLATLAFAETKLDPQLQGDAQKHFEQALDQIEQLRAGLSNRLEQPRETLSHESERTSFFGRGLYVYDEYIAYLLELGRRFPEKHYDRKAFEIFERKAARAALEQIGASAAQHFVGVPPSIVEQENAADAAASNAQNLLTKLLGSGNADPSAVESAKATLASANEQQTALGTQIAARYPQYYKLRHPQPIGVEALQREVLKSGEVMLVYDLHDKESVLWIISHDQPLQLIMLAGRKDLDDAVSAVTNHIVKVQSFPSTAVQDLSSFAHDSYALERKLIPDMAARAIAGAKSLIVVPSGALYKIPFEALVTRDSVADAASAHYLIEDVPISYVPSASLLGVVRLSYAGRQAAQQPLLAFANPTYAKPSVTAQQVPRALESRSVEQSYADLQFQAMRSVLATGGGPNVTTDTFPALPGTATDARAVANALHAPPESIISGDAATRQRVFEINTTGQLKTYRYLLFATHAVLPNPNAGLTQPAIVLAHPERGDGFLTMADVFRLSLNADFVTLSACDTGVVENPSGDGISGLTHAFLYAGTPAISVTLWQVDDAAAPRITPPFFAAMQAGKSPAQAMQQAQLAMIRSRSPLFSHPAEWAPFVIFGDGNLIDGAR